METKELGANFANASTALANAWKAWRRNPTKELLKAAYKAWDVMDEAKSAMNSAIHKKNTERKERQ
jgi:hypothetical protein